METDKHENPRTIRLNVKLAGLLLIGPGTTKFSSPHKASTEPSLTYTIIQPQ